LNFSSQQDAEAFARAMIHALEVWIYFLCYYFNNTPIVRQTSFNHLGMNFDFRILRVENVQRKYPKLHLKKK
jgi:hypothetical protein